MPPKFGSRLADHRPRLLTEFDASTVPERTASMEPQQTETLLLHCMASAWLGWERCLLQGQLFLAPRKVREARSVSRSSDRSRACST